MNGHVINDLTTQGNVKVQVMSPTGKISKTIVEHNTATLDMCDLVAEALIGNPIAGKIPGFIVPTTLDGSVYKSMFSFGIPYQALSKVPLTSETSTKRTVRLEFLIENVFLSVAENKKINGFRLLGINLVGNERPILAEVALSEPLNIKNSNVNLKVTWDIDIAYASQVQNEI